MTLEMIYFEKAARGENGPPPGLARISNRERKKPVALIYGFWERRRKE